MAYVISDEGAYRLGLVLLFGNGLYLPIYLQKSRFLQWRRLQIRVSVTVQVWFMPINKSLLISDEGVYKLGLVLLLMKALRD